MAVFVLHSILREGREAQYDRVHRRIPEDLLAALQDHGIEDWRIWRSGRHLFHVVDCPDLDSVMTALDRDPVNRRWQRLISQYVDHFEEPTGSGWALPLVWRMRDQTDQAG